MNKKTRVIVAILVGISVFAGGFFFSRVNAQTNQQSEWNGQTGTRMMGNSQLGPGMMGNGQYSGMMGGQYGSGMMGNYGDLTNLDPMSLADAETAVTNYLATLNNDNLSLGEIMIFDNHAYAQIMNNENGQGAFEVLIDPVTGNVFPEPGPNMMWNTEYGMMSGSNFGMMGGMMNGSGMMGNGQYGSGMMGNFSYTPDTEINITAEDAISAAQEYLDTYFPGKTADTHADTFPGYYTIHVLENSEPTGMLSVNAYTGQVFFHHWHGTFIEMTGEG